MSSCYRWHNGKTNLVPGAKGNEKTAKTGIEVRRIGVIPSSETARAYGGQWYGDIDMGTGHNMEAHVLLSLFRSFKQLMRRMILISHSSCRWRPNRRMCSSVSLISTLSLDSEASSCRAIAFDVILYIGLDLLS